MVALLLTFSFHFFSFVSADPEVQLGRTQVTGATYAASGVEFFGCKCNALWDNVFCVVLFNMGDDLGISFAKAPVGDRRLRVPVLVTTLNTSTFDATQFGPGCLQTVIGSY